MLSFYENLENSIAKSSNSELIYIEGLLIDEMIIIDRILSDISTQTVREGDWGTSLDFAYNTKLACKNKCKELLLSLSKKQTEKFH